MDNLDVTLFKRETVMVEAEPTALLDDVVSSWAAANGYGSYRNVKQIRVIDGKFTFEVEVANKEGLVKSTQVSELTIDYSRDSLLTPFGMTTLKERYLLPNETSPQEAFRRAAMAFADNEQHAARLYEYSSKLWFMFSTPTLSNPPLRKTWGATWAENFLGQHFDSKIRGMPISCFLNEPTDSRDGLTDHYNETAWLSSIGGGVGAYWGAIRSSGTSTSNGSVSSGAIPFVGVIDRLIQAFSQGGTRRGSYAAYMDISHPEIVEFLDIRKPTGGDQNRKSLNIHNAVVIPDAFMEIIERCMSDPYTDDSWPLVDPHSGKVTETVSARELWQKILELRGQTGEPFIMYSDTVNRALPDSQKELGLRVLHSNLCSEITLAVNKFRTAVCCLSSVNLEYYDEWSKDPQFIEDLIRMLDNVLEFFIQNASLISKEAEQDVRAQIEEDLLAEGFTADQVTSIVRIVVTNVRNALRKAIYSAKRERSLGLGAMGFHSLLQRKGIAFESAMASSINRKVFAHIKAQAEKATIKLAKERGSCPDAGGQLRRNMHLLAIAPNASSSIICGETSPSTELRRGNAYVHKTDSGSWVSRNKYLARDLEELGMNTEEVWHSIVVHKGSIQHLEGIPEYLKLVYRTSMETDQRWVVQHTADRQQYVCQAQSMNVFFAHNANVRYIHQVHFNAWKLGCKTMYYLRSEASRRANSTAASHTVRAFEPDLRSLKEDSACLSCEG